VHSTHSGLPVNTYLKLNFNILLAAKSIFKKRFVDCLERGAFYSFKAFGQHIFEIKFHIALNHIPSLL